MRYITKKILRSLDNFLELSINSNTEPGDNVTFIVEYKGRDKPVVTIEISGISKTVRESKKTSFDVTPYLKEAPNWQNEDGSVQGFRDWREYIELSVAREVNNICLSGRRNFEYRNK